MRIRLWNHSLLGKTLVGTKLFEVKSFIDSQYVKTEMVIHKRK